MQVCVIRPAQPSDVDTIAAFNQAMARETENLSLDLDRLRAGVQGLLARPELGFYLIAERDGDAAGQLMITYEWSDWRNAVFWWIQSVYIRPDCRRMGIFRALYDEAVRRAARQNACGLRLYVEHGNAAARQTYQSLGMKRAPYEMFEVDFVLHRDRA
jgi:ribosomal protein S18 acetylase RimI-like enzyme